MTLTEWADDVCGNGMHDAECGEADRFGWHGRIDGPFTAAEACIEGESLDPDDAEALDGAAGLILSVDSAGFKDVTVLDTAEELEAVWAELEAEDAEVWAD